MHGFGRLEVYLTRLDWMGCWRCSRHILSSDRNYHSRNLSRLLPIIIKPSSRLRNLFRQNGYNIYVRTVLWNFHFIERV